MDEQDQSKLDWFLENEDSEFLTGIGVLEVLRDEFTGLQHLQVFRTRGFGHLMVLDGCVMLTQRDECIYHEMLTHVPLFTHPNPRRLLVVGGGDAGTVRQALLHPGLEDIVLCEIDARVIQASRDYFPELASALEDPRVHVEVGDAIEYVQDQLSSFDVILVDATDPVGPAEGLYATDFYRRVRQALRSPGILVAQGESPFLHQDLVRSIHHQLDAIFPLTRLYQATIPTYPSGWWSFAYAAEGLDPCAPEVLRRIEAAALPTRYHSPQVHQAAFALPPMVRELLEPGT